ncbi:protein N-terminal asparagine amidohydrolase isoform X2 [Ricinus communis]|uniref:protein N-terminal asparagine amidohydrolase isoform X2 n=1 Tax=Ricinus communis TaxID=3988 RepID=UPI00077295B8|nr:protein N-terminal asparagine amidohydrolase isoform X2 [Ricinus communis]|eukprot:XP_015584632.1 protein N-terminal asparagine amidohydrolase isoform X2 [Ricinus communis]
MIWVDGVPFSTSSSKGSDLCLTLMEHPVLVSASHSLKAKQERKFSLSELSSSQTSTQSRWVYIFQREYATVDPALVDYVGTDEATTCVGLVIRNQKNGMTSFAHMDFLKVVDVGLTQMLSGVVDHTIDVDLDVHLIGGFEDVSPKANGTSRSNSLPKLDGYSLPLCAKIIETLAERKERFHIRTLFVLDHNTETDSEENTYPIFNGFVVEMSTGSINPARFDRTTRCPDEIVRRIRVGASYQDPTWDGKLLETYDTLADRFVIAACSWNLYQLHVALTLQHLSDVEILLSCSTSPSAEGPDFVDNMRRQWDYLIEHPDWQYTFPNRQPHIFERTADGGWRRWLQSSQDTSQEPLAENLLQTM